MPATRQKLLKDSFQKLIRRKIWTALGYLKTFEIAKNNVHYHIIAFAKDIDDTQLRDTWSKITGGSFSVNVQRIRNTPEDKGRLTTYFGKHPGEEIKQELAEFRDENKRKRYFVSAIRKLKVLFNTIDIKLQKKTKPNSTRIKQSPQFSTKDELLDWKSSFDHYIRPPDR